MAKLIEFLINDPFKLFLIGASSKFKKVLEQNPHLLLKRNRAGESLLHKTAAYGDLETTSWLIEKGIPVDIKTNPGNATPLMLAVAFNKKEVVRFLLEKNADNNVQDQDGVSILHYAASRNLPEMVKILLSRNSKTDLKDKAGRTALDIAKEFGNNEVVVLLN